MEIHYFPNEARFDKMYFPYYGKRIHVSVCSISAHVGSTPPRRVPLLTASRVLSSSSSPSLPPSGPQEKYLQPLVAVKLALTKEDWNKELTVECRVEGSNLRNNDERDKFLGRITFRVKVQG